MESTSPFVKPSVEVRGWVDPIAGESAQPPESSSAKASRNDGHESTIAGRDDLPYACVFRLPVSRDCGVRPESCDCAEPGADKPLSQSPDRSYGTIQYPAPRLLSVLRGGGRRAEVASACVEESEDTASPAFGYRPAIFRAIAPSL